MIGLLVSSICRWRDYKVILASKRLDQGVYSPIQQLQWHREVKGRATNELILMAVFLVMAGGLMLRLLGIWP